MSVSLNQPNLAEAIQTVNELSSEKGYSVVVKNEKIEPKNPIYLQLQYTDGSFQNIGITHLVHLKGSDWDNKPFEEIARSTDEVTRGILDRIALFFDAKERGLYIDESGTIFDFNGINIKMHEEDKTFSIDDTLVTFGGKPLKFIYLKSEGTVNFVKLESGETELVDYVDQREGKRMIINLAGELYRA